MNTPSFPRRQRGVILILAMIILAAMMIGAAALTRTIGNTNAIAGNLAFKQNSLNVSDIGIETALTDLGTSILPSSQEAHWPGNCSVAAGNCTYYANQQVTDGKGVPATIDWGTIGTVNSAAIPSGYTVQYVVDRMCDPSVGLPVEDIVGNCVFESDAERSTGGGDRRVGGTKFTESRQVAYRVTIRVAGPKSTETFVQAIVKQ